MLVCCMQPCIFKKEKNIACEIIKSVIILYRILSLIHDPFVSGLVISPLVSSFAGVGLETFLVPIKSLN